MRRNSIGRGERGAAMVEAALILPILLLIIFGIIDFSRAYNAKQTLTHASREAVRVYVVTEDTAETQTAFDNATGALNGVTLNLSHTTGCNVGEQVTAEAAYDFDFLLLPFANPMNMTAEAVMRCGG